MHGPPVDDAVDQRRLAREQLYQPLRLLLNGQKNIPVPHRRVAPRQPRPFCFEPLDDSRQFQLHLTPDRTPGGRERSRIGDVVTEVRRAAPVKRAAYRIHQRRIARLPVLASTQILEISNRYESSQMFLQAHRNSLPGREIAPVPLVRYGPPRRIAQRLGNLFAQHKLSDCMPPPERSRRRGAPNLN